MKTLRILAGVLSVALLLLVSSAAQAAAADYIFILKARGNPYWNAMVQGIKETAAEKFITASIHQLANDSAAEEQLNICQALIAKKPKLLAISAVTSAVGIQCMKEAQAKGIIVADMDSNVSVEDAKAAGIRLAYTVGSDNKAIGKKAAEHTAKILNKGDKVIVLEGAVGSVPGNNRRDGFTETLKKIKPDAPIIASVSADWDRLKANIITTDLLLSHPDVRLIYACNDMMGLGAAEAVRVAGKETKIKIIAVDGTADARKAIMSNRMEASVAQLPYLVGKRAVELAIDAVVRRKTNATEIVDTPILTRDILSDINNPQLRYVR
jgi:D-allose transport system substrate-binding protein